VDLPAPFGPMMPRASPGLTSNDTSRTAQNSPSSGRTGGVRRNTFRIKLGSRSRRLSWLEPRANLFQTRSKTITDCGIQYSDSVTLRKRLSLRPATKSNTRPSTAPVTKQRIIAHRF
jgi:hypothetical protein